MRKEMWFGNGGSLLWPLAPRQKKKKVKNIYVKRTVVSKKKGTGVLGVNPLRVLHSTTVRSQMEQKQANRRICGLQMNPGVSCHHIGFPP